MLVSASWKLLIRFKLIVKMLHQRIRIVFCSDHLAAILFLLVPLGLHSQNADQYSVGIAWRVRGAWHIEGENSRLSTGDAVVPGSLLRPEESHDHSVTVLLPDGQRVLYECFTPQDCARGFRVPSLYRKPDSMAIDLMARVNAVSQRRTINGTPVESEQEPRMVRDEAVAELNSENKVEIAGLAAALSNGKYWYEVRLISSPALAEKRQEFEKTERSVTLALPSEGLFDVLIVDHLNTPRIDLLVGAVREPRAANLLKSFRDVQALLKDWNEDYQGWPIHDFQRDYLRSMMLGIRPPEHRRKTSDGNQNHSGDVTAEPIFSPGPGLFQGDTEVKLQCKTSGAIMHYTVDGSQPVNQSPVYRAPIMVKGTELTIKAFASSKDKKDSPVVTGIFRIGD